MTPELIHNTSLAENSKMVSPYALSQMLWSFPVKDGRLPHPALWPWGNEAACIARGVRLTY